MQKPKNVNFWQKKKRHVLFASVPCRTNAEALTRANEKASHEAATAANNN